MLRRRWVVLGFCVCVYQRLGREGVLQIAQRQNYDQGDLGFEVYLQVIDHGNWEGGEENVGYYINS